MSIKEYLNHKYFFEELNKLEEMICNLDFNSAQQYSEKMAIKIDELFKQRFSDNPKPS
ncbi:MAG: hypothetical protein HQK79_17360 [Desulfobacterales bacterium]|nr:hypothetical protein [Desulfobacterales bacterium]